MVIERCSNGHLFNGTKFKQCPYCKPRYTEKKARRFYPDRHEENSHQICAGPLAGTEESACDSYPSVCEEQPRLLYAGPSVRL